MELFVQLNYTLREQGLHKTFGIAVSVEELSMVRPLKDTYTTVDSLYQFLVSEGYSGALNDMVFQYLGDNGETGSITDRIASFDNVVDTTAPEITNLIAGTQTDGDVPVSFDLSESGTIFWVLDSSIPSPEEAESGQASGGGVPSDSGSFSATSGDGITRQITFTSGLGGTYNLSFIGRDAAGNLASAVDTESVTIDSTAPGITSYSPADNATDVATDADLVIVFNESMKTTGTAASVTLKNVGGATVETFDPDTDGTWSTTTNANDTWTVTPTSAFTNEAALAVQYSGFEDVQGNVVLAVSDDTTWNFDVVAAPSYTQNIIASPSVAGNYLALSGASVPASQSQMSLSAWINFTDAADNNWSSRNIRIDRSGTSAFVVVYDSAGATVFIDSVTGIMPVTGSSGSLKHFQVDIDLSVPSMTFYLNGSVTATPTISAGTGLHRTAYDFRIGDDPNLEIADLVVNYGSLLSNSTMYNGGTPPDVGTLSGGRAAIVSGAEFVIGGDMLAADWNSGSNIGPGSVTKNGATNFTNV